MLSYWNDEDYWVDDILQKHEERIVRDAINGSL